LSLLFGDSTIQIEFGEDEYISSFSVNSFNILATGNRYISQQFSNRAILPVITEVEREKEPDSEEIELLSRYTRTRFRTFRTLLETLIKQTKKIAHPSTSLDTIIKMVTSFGLGTSKFMLKDIQDNRYGGKHWKKQTRNWTIETDNFKKLRNLIIANAVPFIVEKCDEILGSFSKQISYMGPVRATAERYYRTQDLAVDEVDFRDVI
jgi:hypothetical protein